MADKAMIGNMELTTVIDMVPPSRAPSAMFPEVPAAAWEPYKDTLEDGQLQLYYGVLVLVGEGKTILVDTGMGPGPHPDRGNVTGNLYELVSDVLSPPDNTRNTNVSPSDQVNYVIHTHLHADHVGWNLRYSGGMPAPNFRRARYIISKDEYDYYTEGKDAGAKPPRSAAGNALAPPASPANRRGRTRGHRWYHGGAGSRPHPRTSGGAGQLRRSEGHGGR